ncbi:tRNA threonylcarbamoyladenosine biosynthesis protein TsaE [hydrothermal vent metagenome]|uniref:tRNA threonylcarbamoyladenosine biosynthesis protein TsaE n=1 Tax=hydrothermal vent metagenome TaxID=652676 RepID=A0A3B0Y8K7_9ZZZZ
MAVKFLPDTAATEALGARLASCCQGGGVVFFQGQLGAGKTTLVRGLLRALGHTGPVKSPTYALVESYHLSSREVHHLDLYRLGDPEELEWIGLRDLIMPDALVLIEWPEQGRGVLPTADLKLSMVCRQQGREVEFSVAGETGDKWLNCLI